METSSTEQLSKIRRLEGEQACLSLPHARPCYRPASQVGRQTARFVIDTDRAVRREICMDSGYRGARLRGLRGRSWP